MASRADGEFGKGLADFKGVMLHAGESYHCSSKEALNQSASNEVATAQLAAKRLESVGIYCDIVSVGSTPTACSYTNTSGITEVRAGVYSLFDLVMHRLGVCTLNDIAISVVSSVIGHNKSRGQIFVDAGWMALSLDKGHDEGRKVGRHLQIRDKLFDYTGRYRKAVEAG